MKSEGIVLSTRCSECDFVLVRKYTTGGWRPPLIKACGRGEMERQLIRGKGVQKKRKRLRLPNEALQAGVDIWVPDQHKMGIKKSTLETSVIERL